MQPIYQVFRTVQLGLAGVFRSPNTVDPDDFGKA